MEEHINKSSIYTMCNRCSVFIFQMVNVLVYMNSFYYEVNSENYKSSCGTAAFRTIGTLGATAMLILYGTANFF